ncbi:MAG: hypothetical protein IPO26_21195 [Saprospiraceae bacterium]|nr:hypothetical protein [Saprospiraceae bacterium]
MISKIGFTWSFEDLENPKYDLASKSLFMMPVYGTLSEDISIEDRVGISYKQLTQPKMSKCNQSHKGR